MAEMGVSQYAAARTIIAACCAALAIQFCSGDPDLLRASWGDSDSTVEVGEDEQVEDMSVRRSGEGGDMVDRKVGGVFIHSMTCSQWSIDKIL
jgi:hypothetical protein